MNSYRFKVRTADFPKNSFLSYVVIADSEEDAVVVFNLCYPAYVDKQIYTVIIDSV